MTTAESSNPLKLSISLKEWMIDMNRYYNENYLVKRSDTFPISKNIEFYLPATFKYHHDNRELYEDPFSSNRFHFPFVEITEASDNNYRIILNEETITTNDKEIYYFTKRHGGNVLCVVSKIIYDKKYTLYSEIYYDDERFREICFNSILNSKLV